MVAHSLKNGVKIDSPDMERSKIGQRFGYSAKVTAKIIIGSIVFFIPLRLVFRQLIPIIMEGNGSSHIGMVFASFGRGISVPIGRTLSETVWEDLIHDGRTEPLGGLEASVIAGYLIILGRSSLKLSLT